MCLNWLQIDLLKLDLVVWVLFHARLIGCGYQKLLSVGLTAVYCVFALH